MVGFFFSPCACCFFFVVSSSSCVVASKGSARPPRSSLFRFFVLGSTPRPLSCSTTSSPSLSFCGPPRGRFVVLRTTSLSTSSSCASSFVGRETGPLFSLSNLATLPCTAAVSRSICRAMLHTMHNHHKVGSCDPTCWHSPPHTFA